MNKETVEIVKKMIEDGNLSQEVAEKYIPELREDEDEKIKKEISTVLTYAEGVGGILTDEDLKKYVTWLEKQNTFKRNWSEDDRIRITNCIQLIGKTGDGEVKWLKSLESRILPQTKQEWSEEDKKYLDAIEKLIMGSRHTGYNGVSRKDAVDWLKSLRPHQKPNK